MKIFTLTFDNLHKKYWETKQRPGQTFHALIRCLEELEAQIIPLTEDHRMSTIFGALHLWIENQVSGRLELPKKKNQLIQLALKIGSTANFCPIGAGNQADKTKTSQAWDVVDGSGGTRHAKQVQLDGEEVGLSFGSPVSSRPHKEKPNQPRTKHNFFKATCYNCGQLDHISINCKLSPREKALNLGKE